MEAHGRYIMGSRIEDLAAGDDAIMLAAMPGTTVTVVFMDCALRA
jgi:hypothetical protein